MSWKVNMLERLKHLDAQILQTEPLILIGEAVGLHSRFKLYDYAQQLSEKLSEFPCKMLQYNPEQLLKSMEEGRAVVVTNLDTGRLEAFAQIWKYGISEKGQDIYEFGSWLGFEKGRRKLALAAGIKLGEILYPNAQLIAVVEQNNLEAQNIIQSFGGIEIPGKYSPVLRNVKGEPAWMKRYDITLKGGV